MRYVESLQFMKSSTRVILLAMLLAGASALAQPATSLSADDRRALSARKAGL